jgi:DNA mismatch repair ATPase MutS
MTFDSWRLLQKFSFGRGDVDDLLSLARTVLLTNQIKTIIQDHLETPIPNGPDGQPVPSGRDSLRKLLNRLETADATKIANKILEAIDEDKLSQQHQLEYEEASTVVEMAESVLSEAGESLKGVPKSLQSKRGSREREKDKDTATNGDLWIMRPR